MQRKEADAEPSGGGGFFSVKGRSPLRLRLAVTSHWEYTSCLRKERLPRVTFVPKDK